MNVPHTHWWSRTKRNPHEPASGEGHREFDTLVRRQSPFVFRVAYAVVRNSYDAEDVVQETFLKLYRTDAWRRMEDEKAFLARTAWRLAVERLPKQQGKCEEPLTDFAGSSPTPEELVLDASLRELIHRMIDSLPEELRQPLALSAIEELNSREIAELMGIAEGTVRTRLMRARQLLREKLAAKNLSEARTLHR